MSEGDAKYPQSTEEEMRKAKPFLKLFSRLNVWVFRATGGRIGKRFPGGGPVGLLTFTGRKTGKRRTIPLVYGLEGERVALIASQGGMPKHPIWYYSLVEQPEVEFQIGSDRRRYRCREVAGEEGERAWKSCTVHHPDFDEYAKRTDRVIPVFVLEPA